MTFTHRVPLAFACVADLSLSAILEQFFKPHTVLFSSSPQHLIVFHINEQGNHQIDWAYDKDKDQTG